MFLSKRTKGASKDAPFAFMLADFRSDSCPEPRSEAKVQRFSWAKFTTRTWIGEHRPASATHARPATTVLYEIGVRLGKTGEPAAFIGRQRMRYLAGPNTLARS